jgi:hypothetical protein
MSKIDLKAIWKPTRFKHKRKIGLTGFLGPSAVAGWGSNSKTDLADYV